MGSQGSGIALTTDYPFGFDLHVKPTTDITPGLTGRTCGIRMRYEVGGDQTTQLSHAAVLGHLRITKDLADGVHAGIEGYIEADGGAATVISGTSTTQTCAGHFAVELGTGVEVSTGWLTGVTVDSSVHADAVISSAEFAGFRVKKSDSAKDWEYGLHIRNSTTGIDIGSPTTGINIDGVMTKGIYIAPTVTAGASITPIQISYSYEGDQIAGDIDNYGIRSAITQNSSNALTLGNRGYIMGMRSDVTVNGYVDDAYSLYAKMSVTGASTANQLYGLNSYFNTGSGAISMDESGNIAGVGITMVGTGDVTCGGTGYGKISGMYIAWKEAHTMTVDTAGIYVTNFAEMKLDSGFRINSSGTTINAFHTHNTSGTITNVLKVEGAHTNLLSLPVAGTAPVSAGADASADVEGSIKILVNDVTKYLHYWPNAS